LPWIHLANIFGVDRRPRLYMGNEGPRERGLSCTFLADNDEEAAFYGHT